MYYMYCVLGKRGYVIYVLCAKEENYVLYALYVIGGRNYV